MQSEFEKTFKQHRDALTTYLTNLGKQRQIQAAEWDTEQNKSDYEFYFTAGWQAAKAQSVSEGRTDFEIINQTLELVDLIALSTNVFQRDPKSKVHPFESENPRVMEWWRTACQIQELLTNTDPDNCDFEEYKAMIESQESKG